ncbi:MAG: hypothetical protein GX626_10580 [Spirochaetales bacterium]|jgi:hypothetical protein|nr:hypothetical protein [Spirochaetales bacterium]
MNKKLIALAMILLLAVGGLFAAVYPGTLPGNVTATLNANIGDYLYHGFIDSTTPAEFDATKTINDAFITDPAFQYGFRTNIGTTYNFEFRMTVGDFLHNTISGAKIKIADVTVGGLSPDPISGYYVILSKTTAVSSGAVNVVIKPAKAAGNDHLGVAMTDAEYYGGANEVAGPYTSTVTIAVVSV